MIVPTSSALSGAAGAPYGAGDTPAYAAAGAATSGDGASSGDAIGDQLGRDTFLKLMVAQLRYQDPLNPTDSAEFLAQSAQFTSLEKLEEVATQTAQALSAQLSFGASGLVGRTVTYTDPASTTGAEAQGRVEGVRFTADGPMLTIGDLDVPMNQVTGVLDSTTAPTEADPDSTTDPGTTTDTESTSTPA
jgi:flagellar basal-body rod modification protein FlgD